MPRAAVPHYLGSDFQSASPGLRFTYYLSIWTERKDQEWKVCRSAEIWDELSEVSLEDQRRLQALRARQTQLAARIPAVLSLHAQATAPFTTGLGNEHPLENGFAFLWPHGLPYLPASGVKGVLRRAAEELARGLWGEDGGWDDEPRHKVKGIPVPLSDIDLLFGTEPQPGETHHFRGCLDFWDVYPQIDKLHVEIMTPHQTHYYQKGEPPHDCGQPNPIKFLTLPPGAAFTFHVVCQQRRLERLASDLCPRWRELLTAAFEHAFQWLGFGAKTAVGYGVMQRDTQAEQRAEEERKQQEKEAREAQMSPEERQIEALRARFEKQKAAGDLQPQGIVSQERLELLQAAQQWQDPKLRCQAGRLLQEIAKDLKWPEKRKKEAREQVKQLLESCP